MAPSITALATTSNMTRAMSPSASSSAYAYRSGSIAEEIAQPAVASAKPTRPAVFAAPHSERTWRLAKKPAPAYISHETKERSS